MLLLLLSALFSPSLSVGPPLVAEQIAGLCPNTVLTCSDSDGCDPTKLYLDFNSTWDTSVKCERGYSLWGSSQEPTLAQANEFKSTICERSGDWIGYQGVFGAPVDGVKALTCIKEKYPLPSSCPDSYLDLSWCADCDKTKLYFVNISTIATKLDSCRLQCDRGFKLVATLSEYNSSIFYKDVAKSVLNPNWSGIVFTLSRTSQYYSDLGPKPYVSCIPDALEQAVPANKTIPKEVYEDGETCGCPWKAIVSSIERVIDHTKLFIQDSSPPGSVNGNCTIQCDTGYSVVNYGSEAISAATCQKGSWVYFSADHSAFTTVRSANFSCKAAPASCANSYNIAPCRAGEECSTDAIRAIAGSKSCTLSCAKGYRLYETIARNNMIEVYYFEERWYGKYFDKDLTLRLSYNSDETPSLTCERYYSAAKQPPPGEYVDCGCSYKFSDCRTCTWDKLFVLDGFGASSKRCTIGCGQGYVLEGGEMNLLSCKDGTWVGTSRTNMSTVAVPTPSGFIRTSCVPDLTVAACSAPPYNSLFSCDGCDRSKLVRQPSTKGGCVLTCDKNFRLVIVNKTTRAITRAQEAVYLQNQWHVYPLGEVVEAPFPLSTNHAQFSCEPATALPEPTTKGPVCGCAYTLKQCPTCDNAQLVGSHDGVGTCTLSCGPGYQLQADGPVNGEFMASATCANYKWFGRAASFQSTFTFAAPPTFACVKVASAKCTAAYTPLSACTTCDSTKLSPLSTLKQCQLGCAAGFRLIANTANTLDGAKHYSELTAVGIQGGSSWSGVQVNGSLFGAAPEATLFVGCEPFKSSKTLAKCGCPYSNVGYYEMLGPRTIWPEDQNCELICEPGFKLKHAQAGYLSLIVCEAGKWVGRNFDGSVTISMRPNPSIGCVKADTNYFAGCANPDWLPLQCPGCSLEPLLPVATGYTCQFTCRAGWRIVAQLSPSTAIWRPRMVALLPSGKWIGTGGAGLLTTMFFGTQPMITCEPDTLPRPADPVTYPQQPSKPCEYCRQPSKETGCPAGKTCTAEFLPMWKYGGNCMQIRCRRWMTMLINHSDGWISTDAINCQSDGTWKTNSTGVALTSNVAVTCDKATFRTPIDEIEADFIIYSLGLKVFEKYNII